jgi:hypothetical protein
MLLALTITFTAFAVILGSGGFVSSMATRRRWRAHLRAAMGRR